MARHKFHRLFPRVRATKACRIAWKWQGEDYEVRGHTKNLSYGGLAAVLPRTVKWTEETASLVLLPEGITLRVRPVRYERMGETTIVAFRVDCVEGREQLWRELTQVPRW